MQRLPFHQLPVVAQIAVGVMFFDAWLAIERFVIERYGIYKYMPYYKVTDPCVWDLAVSLIIVLAIWRAAQRGEKQAA